MIGLCSLLMGFDIHRSWVNNLHAIQFLFLFLRTMLPQIQTTANWTCLHYQLRVVTIMTVGYWVEKNNSPPKDITVPQTVTSSNVVIKAVFGQVLSREQIVNTLKSKFGIKQTNLTNLTPAQLQQALLKKLIKKNNYASVKDGKTNSLSRDDTEVYKEIEV